MRIRPLCCILPMALMIPACGDDDAGRDARGELDAPSDTGATTADVTSEVEIAPDVADTTGADAPPETSEVAPDATADTSDPSYGFVLVSLAPPFDITPDGTTVAIWNALSASGEAWLYDVASDTPTLATNVGPTFRNFPTAIASDLSMTALHGEPVQAGLWDGANWRKLGSLFEDGCGLDPNDATAGDIGGAWDLSADGAVVVGSLWDGCSTVAFRWSEVGQTRDFRALARLGAVPEGASLGPINRATVVSDDGRIAGGFAQTALVDRWPAIWDTTTATGFLLETELFTSDSPGEIMAIETDGTVAGGIWNNEAFVVALDPTPVITKIPALPDVLPGEASRVNALAANGTLVFGQSGGPFLSTPQAFVWTAAKGTRKLADVAREHGLTIAEGVILTNVLAASADGAVVVGTSLDDTFAEKTFVLRLPAAAYAD